METKDLMVGDLVLYTEFGRNEYRRVKIIEPTRVWLDGCKTYIPDAYIEPIPLTPDILEQNGFYYGYTSDEEDLASNTIAQLSEDGKGWCWDEGGGAIKVIFPNVADGGLLVLDDQSFDRHLEMVFCETIYVHELQHVLRLCMIEKDIVL